MHILGLEQLFWGDIIYLEWSYLKQSVEYTSHHLINAK
jgi:hypothetical protein